MSRYRIVKSALVVTKPNGEAVRRDVLLYFDAQGNTFGVEFIGESALKGYRFDVFQGELKRVRDSGEPLDELPTLETVT